LRSFGPGRSDRAVSTGRTGRAGGTSRTGRPRWTRRPLRPSAARTAAVLRDQILDFVGDYRGELRPLRVGRINRNQLVRHNDALL
jgi:hypothetical protein